MKVEPVKDCHFIICRIGKEKFYCPFYYRGHEQLGTDIPEYNDLIEGVVTWLQAQADHEAQRNDSNEENAGNSPRVMISQPSSEQLYLVNI